MKQPHAGSYIPAFSYLLLLMLLLLLHLQFTCPAFYVSC
jgi:hypothetical protein